jgi:hypothetical protein
MTTERLAAGYVTYASAAEVARDAQEPRDGAEREPTTSIFTTVCIRADGQQD